MALTQREELRRLEAVGAVVLAVAKILQDHHFYGEPVNPLNDYNRNIALLEAAFNSHGGFSVADLHNVENALPALLAEVEAKEARVGELEAQAKSDKQAINRVDNLCLEQNKRIKDLEAVGRKLLRFKRKLKRTDPEAYERGKEALWDELETLLPDWDKSDQAPTDRPIEGDGG